MAAAERPVKDLCDESTCSICLEYFKDPVTIPECGHNFCRGCLIQCWGESEAEASCPQCRRVVQQNNLIPNRQLANFVEITKRFSLQSGEEEQGKGRVCQKHQEPLKLFCKEEETPICVVCDRSKEHRHHEVIPLEEASQEYKGIIGNCLEILRKERETILEYDAYLEKESQDLLKLTETERQKTVEKFRQLRQIMEKQEKCLLDEIEEMEKEIAMRWDEHLATLFGNISSLESIIEEMEEKRQKPASELLQDVRSTLQRYERRERLANALSFPLKLKRKTCRFCDTNLLLEDIVKEFKDAMFFKLQFQKANVTLDPDTAHPSLILSKDRKNVTLGGKKQKLPDNPERFNTFQSVLGHEGFTEGRHFWEVTVESGDWWDVGVARKYVRRRSCFSLSPEGGFWALGNWGGEYWTHTSLDSSPLSLSEKPRKIRVTLDYEGREVSFYDADSGAELYVFSGVLFYGETLIPFFRLRGNKTHLRIS
uniref:zinc finger protein RFP-like n=1 Tax=Podarcis muralis TaxID=64176 RepID=UPI0010A03B66|nr:zinc finger protein RFP-like [Podarcis muralis]